jgi:hypothetical protein
MIHNKPLTYYNYRKTSKMRVPTRPWCVPKLLHTLHSCRLLFESPKILGRFPTIGRPCPGTTIQRIVTPTCTKTLFHQDLASIPMRPASSRRRRHLCELDLSLTGITAHSCHSLHSMIKHLQVLDLSATKIITKGGLAHCFSGPPTSSITRLTLRFLEDLTSEQVQDILLASSLELLDVTHNSGIEGRNIEVHPLLWHAIRQWGILSKGVAPKATTKQQEPLTPST